MRLSSMLSIRACKALIPVAAISGMLIVVPAFATRTHRSATAGHHSKTKKTSVSHQLHGQRQIDPDRAREIQSALIREHYLSGEPTGQWDAASQAAMSKFQSDQGWQTKLTPDSRALIKLGLGPNQDSSKPLPGNQASLPTANGTAQPGMPMSNALVGKQTA